MAQNLNIKLVTIEGTSKKTNKPFTGYAFQVGDFQSPMFFPSKIELDYISRVLYGE